MTEPGARSTSVAVTVSIVLVTVITLLLGPAGLLAYRSFSDEQWRSFHEQHAAIADQVAASFASPLWNFDRPTAEKIAEGTLKHAVVSGLRVTLADDHSTLLAHERDAQWRDVITEHAPRAPGSLVATRPIVFNDELLGNVEVFASPRYVQSALRTALFGILAGIIGLDLALVFGLYVLLRRIVLRPLRDIETYALAVSSGDPQRPTSTAGTASGEIANVRTSIVRMVEQLATREASLEVLAEAQRSAYEQLAQLHRRLESAKEEERLFLSHELHDEMGQTLTALKLRLGMDAATQGPGASAQDPQLIQLVDRLIERVRKIALGLRPPLLDELGIESALRALIDAHEGLPGAKITLRTSGVARRFAPELEMVCFRIVQEAVTNVRRHSEASRAEVEVRFEDRRLSVIVTDDGRGVSAEHAAQKSRAGHLGVVGMRERARALGGEFTLSPAQPGETRPGTRIEATLPVADAV